MRLPNFAFALAAAGLVMPQIALAHTRMVSSTPAANADVAAPTTIVLRFNEALIAPTAKAEIAMTGMPGMANHAPSAITGFTTQLAQDRKSMTLQLARPLAKGTYRVTWSAAGADTHRMSGNFSFTVK